MKTLARKIALVLLSILVMQSASAQLAVKDCPDCPEMVVIPAGSFVMGSDPFNKKTAQRPNESPPHQVQIQGFAIGKYELTQEQWYAVMGSNPSANVGRTYPMEQVSWYDIQQFIGKLNEKTGKKYRLPNEAEWEYAAKAGTNTDWSFGNDESNLGSYAWYDANSRGKTHEVGQKQPNPFGLFDMHGNVWEWVEDCWHESYVGASTDGSAWTTGCSGNFRVLRGGSALSFPQHGGASFRHKDSPESRALSIGFRLARDLTNDDVQRFSKAAKGQSGALKGGPSAIEEAKQKCDELGFETGTEAYGKCVLKLSK